LNLSSAPITNVWLHKLTNLRNKWFGIVPSTRKTAELSMTTSLTETWVYLHFPLFFSNYVPWRAMRGVKSVNKNIKNMRALALGAGLALCWPAISQATAVDTIGETATFSFTSDHCTGTCGTSPFATAVVTFEGGGDLHFSVSLVNAQAMVNTGFPLTLGFNLSGAPTITYSNLTAGFIIPDVLSGNQQAQGAGFVTQSGEDLYHVDGTGYFGYGVLWDTNGGGNGFTGTLTFDIQASGLLLESLIQNGNGQFMALDVLGSNGKTGPVDASNVTICQPGQPGCGSQTETPIPGALPLFGSVVGGGYLIFRRRKKQAAKAAA